MGARRSPLLLGRAGEREALDRLLENVRGGQSAVLVIRGEAGVGKTALLHYCARQASGFRVARHRRRRVRDGAAVRRAASALRADARPARRACRSRSRPRCGVALGLSSGAAPDRFLVALAVLSLLSEVAEERPLLCFVDDAQWLDAASRQVLGFVARRLLAESVAIVFAVREPTDERELAGLPELRARRARRGGRARAARDGHPRPARRARPRPDRRRDARQPAGAARAAARADRDAAGRRLRAAGGRGAAGADRGELPAAARGAARGRPAAVAAGGRGAGRRPAAGVARGRAPRHRVRGGRDETEGLLAIGERVPLPPPAGALGGLPLGVGAGAPGGAPGAGRGDRRRGRPGPSRLASRRRGAGARRGRRARARALGRPRAGARRARRGGGVPAARGRADARPGPARRARAGRRRRPACRPARSTRRSRCWRRPRPGRSTSSSAPASDLLQAEIAFAQNRGSDAPLLLLAGRTAARAARRPASRARPTSTRWSAALFAGRLATAGSLLDVSRAVRDRPRPDAHAAPVRPAARRPRAACSPTGRRRRHAGAAAGG